MTDLPEFDERYPNFREFAALRERVVALEMQRIPAAAPQATVQHDALALATQRALDMLDRPQRPGASSSPVLRALAVVGAAAIGAVGMYFFLGHH